MIILGSLSVCCPAYISEFIYQYYPEVQSNAEFQARYSTLLAGFNAKNDLYAAMFYPIFLFRRTAAAAALVILAGHPYIQLTLLVVISISA